MTKLVQKLRVCPWENVLSKTRKFSSLTRLFFARQPLELILFLHETAGARFGLIPGDYPSRGMKEERLRLGEMKMLGITKSIKSLKVQRQRGTCKDYSIGDSQAKCYLQNVLLPKLLKNGTNCEGVCHIPQLQDILELSEVLRKDFSI